MVNSLKEAVERSIGGMDIIKIWESNTYYNLPFLLEPPVLLPLTFGSDVVDEGEFAQLVCIVRKGDEPLTLSWALKGDIVSSEPGLTTASLGTRTSMLTINSVGYRHSGTYTCTAKNNAGVTSQTAELKVNGK